MARKFKTEYKEFVRTASNTMVTVEMDGAEGLEELIRGLGEKMLAWGGGAMFEVGNGMMNLSKEIVPVDDHDLQKTGTTHAPSFTDGGKTIEVILSYGGHGVDYALTQHDTPNPPFSHEEGRTWKYLETPVNAAAGELGPAIADAIRGRIGRGGA